MLWSAEGAGPGAPHPAAASNLCGIRRISTNLETEAAAELSSSGHSTQLWLPCSLPCHLQHRAPWELCHAILLCPNVPRDSCLLEYSLLPVDRVLYVCLEFWYLYKPTKTQDRFSYSFDAALRTGECPELCI